MACFAKLAEAMADALDAARTDASKIRDTLDPVGASLRSLERGDVPAAWAELTGLVAPPAGARDAHSVFDELARLDAAKPPRLAPWLGHVARRHGQLKHWPPGGLPPSVWLPGLFRPGAFFAALRRARVDGPPSTEPFACSVLPFPASAVRAPPDRGAYVHGLRVEGGRFDDGGYLDDDANPYAGGRDGGRHVHACLWVRPATDDDDDFADALAPSDDREPPSDGDGSGDESTAEKPPNSYGGAVRLSATDERAYNVLGGGEAPPVADASGREAPSRAPASVGESTSPGVPSGPPPNFEARPHFDAPVYRTRVRDDFVATLRVLSNGPADHWVMRGCAFVCGEVDL